MNKPVLSQTSEIKIGKVTYIVNTHYKKDGRETAEDKLFRLVSNRISVELNNSKESAEKAEIPCNVQ